MHSTRFSITIRTTLIFLAILLLCFIPFYAFGVEECENLKIDLEVAIGDEKYVEGLTNYITIVYQFIIAAITILSVVVIMYWGFRWITAAGNQTIIGNAKEGIQSALIGVVIGLTSYTILFMINASYVSFPKICPTGLEFQEWGSDWETCTNKAASKAADCTAYDYCDSENGCACKSLRGSTALYCLPLAENELEKGIRCQEDNNCKDPLTCSGGTLTKAGECLQVNNNTDCTQDPTICIPPLECMNSSREKNVKRCMTPTGRSNGQYCENDNECESGVCEEAGYACIDDKADQFCNNDGQCGFGYDCKALACEDATGKFACCKEKVAEDDCDTDNGCPEGLFCVEADGGTGSSCQSGAEGSHCDSNEHCLEAAPYCVKDEGITTTGNSCQTGAKGSYCDNDEDCSSTSPYCVANDGIPFAKTCQNGDRFSPCDETSECDAGYTCRSNYCHT